MEGNFIPLGCVGMAANRVRSRLDPNPDLVREAVAGVITQSASPNATATYTNKLQQRITDEPTGHAHANTDAGGDCNSNIHGQRHTRRRAHRRRRGLRRSGEQCRP